MPESILKSQAHRSLDAIKHCQDRMKPEEEASDYILRNTIPSLWTEIHMNNVIAADRRINSWIEDPSLARSAATSWVQATIDVEHAIDKGSGGGRLGEPVHIQLLGFAVVLNDDGTYYIDDTAD